MDQRRDLTKELLAGCFRELMETRAFEKITIKNITDKAGLIRPTFYKHFQDKYEILEWIFMTEIADKTTELIDSDRFFDALLILCRGLEENKAYYRKAFRIPGPNSFREVLTAYIYDNFLKIAQKHHLKLDRSYPYLTPALAARFYMNGLVSLLEDWIFDDKACSAEEFCRTYQYLLMNSVPELFALVVMSDPS